MDEIVMGVHRSRVGRPVLREGVFAAATRADGLRVEPAVLPGQAAGDHTALAQPARDDGSGPARVTTTPDVPR